MLKTLLSGDILLVRDINDPKIIKTPEYTCGNWSKALLCIGDECVLESNLYGIAVHPLDFYFRPTHILGLYRITPELSNGQMRYLLGLVYHVVGKPKKKSIYDVNTNLHMTGSEFIATIYQKLDIISKDLDTSNIEAYYFDHSNQTVRVV